MVENRSPNTILFECDASNSEGLISSRNTLLTHDVIFPKQRQIVLTIYMDPIINAYSLSAKYHSKIINKVDSYLHFPEIGDDDILYLPQSIQSHK